MGSSLTRGGWEPVEEWLPLSPCRETIPRCSAKASSQVRLIGPSSRYLGMCPCAAPRLLPCPTPRPRPSCFFHSCLRGGSAPGKRGHCGHLMENTAQADISVLVCSSLSLPEVPDRVPASQTAAAHSRDPSCASQHVRGS